MPRTEDAPPSPIGRLLAGGLGCVGALVLGGVLVLAIIYARIRGSAPYQEALQFAAHDQALATVIGAPTSVRWTPTTTRLSRVGEDWRVQLRFLAKGERGETIFAVDCTREGDVWAPCTFVLQRDGQWVTPDRALPHADDPERRALDVLAAVSEAQALYDATRYADAATRLDPVIDADPTRADALRLRGRCRAQMGDDIGAAVDLEAVVRLTPGDAEAWKTLAWVRLHAAQDYEAITALNRYLALEPRDARALNDRANARVRIGEMSEALVDAKVSCDIGYEGGCVTLDRLQRARR